MHEEDSFVPPISLAKLDYLPLSRDVSMKQSLSLEIIYRDPHLPTLSELIVKPSSDESEGYIPHDYVFEDVSIGYIPYNYECEQKYEGYVPLDYVSKGELEGYSPLGYINSNSMKIQGQFKSSQE